MRFDHQKAFPYPVLRSDIDDYVDGEFQVTVDLMGSEDGTRLTAKILAALSVNEIQERISAGEATFIYVFSCRETFFRTAVITPKFQVEEEFFSGNFKGEVLIYPFIVATKEISQFKCADINPEFGVGPFTFHAGEVLAAESPRAVYIDRHMFKPVSSVFELVKSDALAGNEWRLSFDQDKVQIEVSEKVKERLDVARNRRENRAILINSIYFAAVVAAVEELKEDRGYEQYLWGRVIRQQCHNASLDIDRHTPYTIAQNLLKYPLGLLLTYVFVEEDS